jgi:hypothetical protein
MNNGNIIRRTRWRRRPSNVMGDVQLDYEFDKSAIFAHVSTSRGSKFIPTFLNAYSANMKL